MSDEREMCCCGSPQSSSVKHEHCHGSPKEQIAALRAELEAARKERVAHAHRARRWNHPPTCAVIVSHRREECDCGLTDLRALAAARPEVKR